MDRATTVQWSRVADMGEWQGDGALHGIRPEGKQGGRVIGERRMRGEGRALPHCSSPVTCYYGTVLVSI